MKDVGQGPGIAVDSNKEIYLLENTAISSRAYHTKGTDIRDALSTRKPQEHHIMKATTKRLLARAGIQTDSNENERALSAIISAAIKQKYQPYTSCTLTEAINLGNRSWCQAHNYAYSRTQPLESVRRDLLGRIARAHAGSRQTMLKLQRDIADGDFVRKYGEDMAEAVDFLQSAVKFRAEFRRMRAEMIKSA